MSAIEPNFNFKSLGDWGRLTNVNQSGSQHITQTNDKAKARKGAHSTTQVNGVSFRTYFDKNGNFLNNDW
jgi:hypothetical protein